MEVSDCVIECLCILRYILCKTTSKRDVALILKSANSKLIRAILEIAQNTTISAAFKKRIRGKKNIIKYWTVLVRGLRPVVAELHGSPKDEQAPDCAAGTK